MQTICASLQTDNHTNTSSLSFYRPKALPDIQPTVSKHWRRSHAPCKVQKRLLTDHFSGPGRGIGRCVSGR